LGVLDRFRKKEEKAVVEKVISELEQICGDDKETYQALYEVMFLDPRKVTTSMKDAADNGKKYEKSKDFLKAKTSYEIAGGLAIYEGNVKKVIESFTDAERVSGTKYAILKNPDKAVTKAQEYYKKYLTSSIEAQ
jgi:hypothetical protein